MKDWWIDFGSTAPKNTTLDWFATDTRDAVTRNISYPYDVTYTFNDFGMRSRKLEKVADRLNILVSGCSHTVGVGVPEDMTWPRRLSQLIPNSVVHNVAVGGASSDYVARSIYIAMQYLEPDVIFILWPDPARFEYYTQQGALNIQSTHVDYPRIFVDDTHHSNNLKKNRLLIDLMCAHIPTYHGTVRLTSGRDTGLARDGAHGCHLWHLQLAQSFYFKYQHQDLTDKFTTFQDIMEFQKNVQP